MDFDLRHLLPIAVLVALLLAAVVCDVRERRIPNRIVVIGLICGLLMNTLLTPGAGLFSPPLAPSAHCNPAWAC